MTDEEFRQAQLQRQKRRKQQRKKRRRKAILSFILMVVIGIAVVLAAIFIIKNFVLTDSDTPGTGQVKILDLSAEEENTEEDLSAETESGDASAVSGETFTETAETVSMDSEEVTSVYGVLVNVDTGTVVAEKNADDVVSPASMTKILTVLTAADNIEESQLDDMVTITAEMTDYAYQHECSVVGYEIDEQVSVRELFYGTILPSGGDAASALATYVGGSIDGFADLMNAECEKLGISDTAHFTNPVGVYDENLHCTMKDMAVILNAAMQNSTCRDALSAHTYTTAPTEQHPDGIILSNWFLRRIEDKDCGGTVVAAKTGYVVESGNCAASYFTANDGTNYICVTGNTHSAWRAIYDHLAVYNIYAVGNVDYVKEPDATDEETTDEEATGEETTDGTTDATTGEATDATTDGTTTE